VLEKGKIIERGTHKQLLEQKGAYYRLSEMQQIK
jgi:ABC-type multidrug transport system fused ATPase/permease subunit